MHHDVLASTDDDDFMPSFRNKMFLDAYLCNISYTAVPQYLYFDVRGLWIGLRAHVLRVFNCEYKEQ